MLSLVGEGLFFERLQYDLNLLFEQIPVGFSIQHGRAEGFHLSSVVPTANAEDDPAFGQDVGHGKVFGQAQRMPHRRDVKPATELQPFGLAGQVQAEHQKIGDAFVPFGLEVMLGQPELVIAQPVQMLRDVHRPIEDLGQLIVGVPPVVGRRTGESQIVV